MHGDAQREFAPIKSWKFEFLQIQDGHHSVPYQKFKIGIKKKLRRRTAVILKILNPYYRNRVSYGSKILYGGVRRNIAAFE